MSVGNVVNVGCSLYRTNFRRYFKQATIAHLWLLVPLYGWAKYSAISALMVRSSLDEIVGNAESIEVLRQQANRKLWQFLIINLRVILRTILAGAVGFVIFSFIYSIVVFTIGTVLMNSGRVFNTPFEADLLIGLLALGVILLAAFQTYSRLMLGELLLMTDPSIKAVPAMRRS